MSKGSRRDRREVGDETRGRIDELAGGWKLPADAGVDGGSGATAARGTPVAGQPAAPPPGATSQTASAEAIGDEAPTIEHVPAARSGAARSAPPPPPRSRPAPTSRPPHPRAAASESEPTAPRPARRSAPPPPPPGPARPRPRASSPPPVPPAAAGPPKKAPSAPPPSTAVPPAKAATAAPPKKAPSAPPPSTAAPPAKAATAAPPRKAPSAPPQVPSAPAVAAKGSGRDDEKTAIDPAATERAAASVGKKPSRAPGGHSESGRRAAIAPDGTPSELPPPAVVAPDADDESETAVVDPDAPAAARPPAAARTGSLRLPESLPRQPGVLGDLGYLWRAARRIPAARRELADVEDQIVTEREGRAQRLLEVARNALADADLDTTLVGRAREHLVTLEEIRSQHAGAAAAADEEVAAVERKLEEGKDQRAERRDDLRRERERLEASLEPLRKRQSQARKRFAAVRKTFDELGASLAAAEARLLAAETGADARACEAEIASLSAERESVAAEEPQLAAELDELEPEIASLEASLAANRDSVAKLAREDERAERRAADEIAAVRARQTVDEGVATDLAGERQEALLALGESLSDQRPEQFAWRLRAIEEHDLALASLQRRALELRELVASVEKLPLLRGGLYLLLALGAIAAVLLALA